MIPMRMEEECLECHRETLVPVGGLRGARSGFHRPEHLLVGAGTHLAHDPVLASGHLAGGLATLYAYWSFLRRRAAEHVSAGRGAP